MLFLFIFPRLNLLINSSLINHSRKQTNKQKTTLERCKPRDAKAEQLPPGSQEKAGKDPTESQRDHDPVKTLIPTSSLQNCKRINFCCVKGPPTPRPRLCSFVTAAL